MNCRVAAVGLSLLGLLGIAPQPCGAAELHARPLQLRLAPPLDSHRARAPAVSRALQPAGIGSRRAEREAQAAETLRQRAVASFIASAEVPEAMTPSESSATFRFERQGSAARDLSRGYKEMCANLSQKIWDEPNGRRVRFDVAGKPGIGVEIPLR